MAIETGSWADIFVAIGTVVVAIGTIALAYIGHKQLSSLVETLRMGSLMAVLQMESEMNIRKQRVDEINGRIMEEGIRSPPNAALLAELNGQHGAAIENWLNSADRLAFCIIKGYVPAKDWKAEYRTYLNQLVVGMPQRFNAGTRFRNIVDLDNQWQRE
jgi:hypothetical protein